MIAPYWRLILVPVILSTFLQSLKAEDAKDPIQKADRLNNLAWENRIISIDSMIAHASRAEKIATSNGYEKGQLRSRFMIGEGNRLLGKTYVAENSFKTVILKQSKQIIDTFSFVAALNSLGIIHDIEGRYDSATTYYRRSLSIRQLNHDSSGIMRCLNNLGVLSQNQGDFDKGIELFEQSLEYTPRGDSVAFSRTLYKLGRLHVVWWSHLNNKSVMLKESLRNEAIRYFSQGLSVARRHSDVLYSGNHSIELGRCYLENANFYRAFELFRYSRVCYQKFNSADGMADAHSGIGSVHLEIGNIDSAISHFRIALNIFGNNDLIDGVAYSLNNIAVAHEQSEEVDSAISYYHKLEKLLNDLQWNDEKTTLFENLYKLYKQTGKNKSALEYLEAYQSLQDSIFSIKSLNEYNDIRIKYNTEKEKNKTIMAQQENEKIKKRNMVLSVIIAAITIISILLAILFQQRLKAKNQLAQKNDELHIQKLDELAKEKQLEKITALMEGQEQERARIAGELHDGLGSLLATVKHHFEVVEDKMDTGQEQYEKAYDLLDQASEEVRRISHDMASNVLSKFGLVPALRDLVETVSNEQLKINLKVTGLEDRLENSTEIHLFRIIQELVSNILRHAKATEATIQLVMRDDALSLMVEDNGQGFDANNAIKEDGMGLGHLKARVEHLNGVMEVDSVVGRGTTTVIEIPVKG